MPAQTILDLLAEQTARTPSAPALQAPGRQPLSFERLLKQIEGVVAKLNAHAIGRNDRVAVILPNGPEMATACLAVAAGATCAPLNPEYKAAEFEYFLSALNAKALLIQSGLRSPAREVAREMDLPVLDVSGSRSEEAGRFGIEAESITLAEPNLGGFAKPDDVALVLHTSGSTSVPKVVPLTQRNVCASAANVSRSLALSADDRALNMMPLFHIGGLVDLLLAPLGVGGSAICTMNFSAANFLTCLEALKPTWYQGVPTMLQEILAHIERDPSIAEGHSLRFVRAVSAALPASVREEFEYEFQCPVIEIYGMTEAAGLITSNPLDPALRRTGSVGVAAGPEVAIVDEDGELVANGKSGEVAIRGTSVMSGYEGLPESDAYSIGHGWLRTGDQGWLDQDGSLFLTGRIKEIINRGGEKISPKEVDRVLLGHPSVAQAATFAIPHVSLGEDVAAAVVLKAGVTLSKRELIEFVGERLAYFKVPRAVYFLKNLPTGPSGKLRRLALAEKLGLGAPAVQGERVTSVAPVTPVAVVLAELLWAEVLGVGSLGIHDNFFDLGGDSLKAANFANKVQQKWSDTIYVSAIFDAPSISEFEAYLRSQYPELVANMLGQHLTPDQPPARSRVNAITLDRLRRAIAPAPPLGQRPHRKNRQAIFILSTPRSGSTLLRVMLGGHSRLFAPPELYLLSFADLAQRKAWHAGTHQSLLEGNIRGLMQLRNMGVDQAEALMAELERRRTPVHRYYGMLQEWLGDRTLVDKTPWNAVHPAALERGSLLRRCSVHPLTASPLWHDSLLRGSQTRPAVVSAPRRQEAAGVAPLSVRRQRAGRDGLVDSPREHSELPGGRPRTSLLPFELRRAGTRAGGLDARALPVHRRGLRIRDAGTAGKWAGADDGWHPPELQNDRRHEVPSARSHQRRRSRSLEAQLSLRFPQRRSLGSCPRAGVFRNDRGRERP